MAGKESRPFSPEISGGLSPKARAVVLQAAAMTDELVTRHPEIADLYRGGLTRPQIAEKIVPDVTPSVGRAAIGNVLKELIPPEERKKIYAERKARTLRLYMESLGVEGFKEHQKEAARRSNQDYPISPEIRDKMLKTRGITPWTDTEKQFVFSLSGQPDFQHQSGPNKGHPDRKKITKALNDAFHGGKPERSKRSIKRLLSSDKTK